LYKDIFPVYRILLQPMFPETLFAPGTGTYDSIIFIGSQIEPVAGKGKP
jgi:hypothetical protein